MHNYNLTFADGKSCRCIVMTPTTEAEDIARVSAIFCGRMQSMERVILPIPAKLPWRRDGMVWRLRRFTLSRLEAKGQFRVEWPAGSSEGTADQVRQAVVDNWRDGS